MAIGFDCINIVVPIEAIDRKYLGGFAQFKRDYRTSLDGFLFDGHLLSVSFMNGMDAESHIRFWQEKGLELYGVDEHGRKFCKDICPVEGYMGGPHAPCDWLEFDYKEALMWKKGEERGERISLYNRRSP